MANMVYGSLGMPVDKPKPFDLSHELHVLSYIEIIARQAHFLALDLLNPPKTTYRRFQQFISVAGADLRNEFVCLPVHLPPFGWSAKV